MSLPDLTTDDDDGELYLSLHQTTQILVTFIQLSQILISLQRGRKYFDFHPKIHSSTQEPKNHSKEFIVSSHKL